MAVLVVIVGSSSLKLERPRRSHDQTPRVQSLARGGEPLPIAASPRSWVRTARSTRRAPNRARRHGFAEPVLLDDDVVRAIHQLERARTPPQPTGAARRRDAAPAGPGLPQVACSTPRSMRRSRRGPRRTRCPDDGARVRGAGARRPWSQPCLGRRAARPSAGRRAEGLRRRDRAPWRGRVARRGRLGALGRHDHGDDPARRTRSCRPGPAASTPV